MAWKMDSNIHSDGWCILTSKPRMRTLKAPLHHPLWTVSDQPLDKQAARDLLRLSFSSQVSSVLWQTPCFEVKWKEVEPNRRATRPASLQQKCCDGRSRWAQSVRRGCTVLSQTCYWCLLSQTDSLRVMWARLFTTSLTERVKHF